MESTSGSSAMRQQRLNPKHADALERRKRMTQQRQQLTQRIRKQKKVVYLAQKRQLTTSKRTTATASLSSSTVVETGASGSINIDIINNNSNTSGNQQEQIGVDVFRSLFRTVVSIPFPRSFCGNTNEIVMMMLQQLHNAQMALAALGVLLTNDDKAKVGYGDDESCPLVILTSSDDDEQLASEFLQRMLEWTRNVIVPACNTEQQQQTVETSSPKEQLQRLKNMILKTLVDLSSFSRRDSDSYYGRVPVTWSELIVRKDVCSSLSVAPAASPPSTISWLETICQILMNDVLCTRTANATNSNHNEADNDDDFNNNNNNITDNVAYMCCLIIGNVVGEGTSTIHYISPHLKVDIVRTLIATISASQLQHDHQQQQQQQQHQFCRTSKFDILAPTAAWSLTNLIRNDASSHATTYVNDQLLSYSILQSWLCQHQPIATQAAWMIASLTSKEEETTQYLAKGLASSLIGCLHHPVTPDQQVPLLQAIGNLAGHSSLVPGLLLSTVAASSGSQITSMNLTTILQKMIADLPASDPRLIPAIWLTGCLLVDTGAPSDHPSTTIAGPTLVPVVMARLGGERNTNTGPRELKLEEERELACALWNAFEQPPDLCGEWSTDQDFALAMPKSTLQVLVKLMKSNDDDAVLAAVHVVDLYLRRVGGTSMESLNSFQDFMRTLEEEDAVHALEAVCDSHVEDAANVAADLIDDFFAELYEDEGNIDDQWNGGINLSYPTENAFGNLDGGGGFGASPTSSVTTSDASSTTTRGMGRGRGATLPSWMAR